MGILRQVSCGCVYIQLWYVHHLEGKAGRGLWPDGGAGGEVGSVRPKREHICTFQR